MAMLHGYGAERGAADDGEVFSFGQDFTEDAIAVFQDRLDHPHAALRMRHGEHVSM